MDAFLEIFDQLPAWAVAITSLITACAGIAALTPTKIDDKVFGVSLKVFGVALRVINTIGLNVGKAKNADDV